MSKKIWLSAKPESMNKLQKEPEKLTISDSVYENQSNLKGKTMQQWPSEGDQESLRGTHMIMQDMRVEEKEKEKKKRKGANQQ